MAHAIKYISQIVMITAMINYSITVWKTVVLALTSDRSECMF